MTDEKATKKLEEIRKWAQKKIQGGAEPPWSWYQYMKLIETIDEIVNGMNATISRGNLQQSRLHRGTSLRLVDSKSRPNIVQRRQDTEEPQMPM